MFDDDILRHFYQHKSIQLNDHVVLSTNIDDWLKSWIGLLLVNAGNKYEKKREEKENGQKLQKKMTNTTEGQNEMSKALQNLCTVYATCYIC